MKEDEKKQSHKLASEMTFEDLAQAVIGSNRRLTGHLEALGLEVLEKPGTVTEVTKTTDMWLIYINKRTLNLARAIVLFQERIEAAKKRIREKHQGKNLKSVY